MLRAVALAAAASALLAACAGSGTPTDLERDTGLRASYEVPIPSDVAYARILRGTRACYDFPFVVEADYFPDKREGRVSASLKTMFSLSTAYVAQVSPSANGAIVRIAYHQDAQYIGATIRSWLVDENYSSCVM